MLLDSFSFQGGGLTGNSAEVNTSREVLFTTHIYKTISIPDGL